MFLAEQATLKVEHTSLLLCSCCGGSTGSAVCLVGGSRRAVIEGGEDLLRRGAGAGGERGDEVGGHPGRTGTGLYELVEDLEGVGAVASAADGEGGCAEFGVLGRKVRDASTGELAVR